MRTLNGKPFPATGRGQLIGTVKARGGPLTHFVVDDARGDVPATRTCRARCRASPARASSTFSFRRSRRSTDFNVDAQSLDLRTIEYLYPDFPRLAGFVSGTATLDSSWLDVRFSNARPRTIRTGPASRRA